MNALWDPIAAFAQRFAALSLDQVKRRRHLRALPAGTSMKHATSAISRLHNLAVANEVMRGAASAGDRAGHRLRHAVDAVVRHERKPAASEAAVQPPLGRLADLTALHVVRYAALGEDRDHPISWSLYPCDR